MLNTTFPDAPRLHDPSNLSPALADAMRAERLARALAPTVYCPESRVEACVAESKQELAP